MTGTGAPPRDAPRDDRAHVLLVEDSALVAEALGILLDASGYRVTTAVTIAEAAAADGGAIDALLLDLTLPDGDGLALLEVLAARGRTPRATIALTGHDDDATRARCRAAGCAAVLVKPIASAALLGTLAATLAGTHGG